MAPHSSTLASKIPWTEEPGRLQSMGSLWVDTTEWLHLYFSLSHIGEGNGNPLQCSCLENPRDGEPGRLLSMGSHRVGHNWSALAAAAARKEQAFCEVSQVGQRTMESWLWPWERWFLQHCWHRERSYLHMHPQGYWLTGKYDFP